MKLVKIVLAAIILSIIASFVLALISYTPAAEREPETYYSSILEIFIFTEMYLAPLLIGLAILGFLLFVVLSKYTRLTRLPKTGISFVASATLIWLTFFLLQDREKTNDLYLIPEGFVGDVYVFYNVKGAPKVKQEDGYEIHPINEKGYYATSTPDMDYGTVTDKYFYIDEKGNRTPIDEKCVSLFGTGGTSTSENEDVDLIYTGFSLTKDQCSEEFRTENHGEEETRQEMVREILKKYYGMEDYW